MKLCYGKLLEEKETLGPTLLFLKGIPLNILNLKFNKLIGCI